MRALRRFVRRLAESPRTTSYHAGQIQLLKKLYKSRRP